MNILKNDLLKTLVKMEVSFYMHLRVKNVMIFFKKFWMKITGIKKLYSALKEI